MEHLDWKMYISCEAFRAVHGENQWVSFPPVGA